MAFESLFEAPHGRYARWYTFENPEGKKGQGAMTNHGHKGMPSYQIMPGERVVLTDCEGPGIIQQIWMTYDDFKSERRIRQLHLEMYWDGEETPAVNVPVEDFFCQAAWPHKMAFENALFSSPEGRNFNCFIPMPFKKKAKVVLVNDSPEQMIEVYYCIEVMHGVELPDDFLYFHCVYQPERKTTMDVDYEILPKVTGIGRYLGTNIMVRADKEYHPTWFGEGEVKIYLDGDEEYPTLVGTGTEDYILTAWGQGEYSTAYAGCTLMHESEENGLVTAFYRLHIPNPVYFEQECRVTIQQIGGSERKTAKQVMDNGVKMKVIYGQEMDGEFRIKYDEDTVDINNEKVFWVNFLREDFYSSVAYLYLNRPAL